MTMATPTRWSLRLLSASYFLQATGSLAIAGGLQAIAAEWSLTNAQSAYLIAVFGITFAVCAPLLQMVIGHLYRRQQLLIGLSLFTVGALLFAFAPNYPILLSSRVIMGLGAALMGPLLVALGADMVPLSQQGSAIASVLMGLSLAHLLGIPLASWIANSVGPRKLFMLIAILGFITALLTRRYVPGYSQGHRIKGRTLLALLLTPKYLSAFLVVFFLASGVYTTYSFIEPIIRDVFHGDSHAVTFALAILGGAGLLGNFFVIKAAAHFTATRMLLAGMALLLFVLLLLLYIPKQLGYLMSVLVLWAFATDLLWPTQQRRIVEISGQFRGMALALTASFLFAGISLGSTLSGWVYPRWGYIGLLLGSISAIVLATICVWLSQKFSRQ